MKYLFPTPVVWDGNDSRYLQRDGARFAEYFTSQGHTAIKIILDNGADLPPPKSPLLEKATYRQWCSPDYWRAQHADAILLYGGLSPKMLPVVIAMKNAGCPNVLLKMDSAFGVYSFPQFWWTTLKRNYHLARQTYSVAQSFFRALLRVAQWATGRNNRFCLKYLHHFDTITCETPLALINTQKYLLHHGQPETANKVVNLPHPVPATFAYSADSPEKVNRIIAVAIDWRNPRKGGTILANAIAKVLIARQDYSAVIVGQNSDLVKTNAIRHNQTLAARINAEPLRNSIDIRALYQTSKIFVLPSGSEGAPNVVPESLCCGCSIVFPPELLQLKYISDAGAGTMSAHRSANSIFTAIMAECKAWDEGAREPKKISHQFSEIFRIDRMHLPVTTRVTQNNTNQTCFPASESRN